MYTTKLDDVRDFLKTGRVLVYQINLIENSLSKLKS